MFNVLDASMVQFIENIMQEKRMYEDSLKAMTERMEQRDGDVKGLKDIIAMKNKDADSYRERIRVLDQQFNILRFHNNQLEGSVKILGDELRTQQDKNRVLSKEAIRMEAHYDNARRVISDQDRAIIEKNKVIAKLKNIIVGQTDCSTECGAYGDLEKENKMLVEKMATLSKKIDHRNRVLREVVDSHRDFVRDIEASVKLEKGYDKNCVNPTLARLAGFKATKENRS